MTKNTAHSECSHPSTKAARAACRRAARKITVQNPTADDMIEQLIGSGRAVSENIEREARKRSEHNHKTRTPSLTTKSRCPRCQDDLVDRLEYARLVAICEQS